MAKGERLLNPQPRAKQMHCFRPISAFGAVASQLKTEEGGVANWVERYRCGRNETEAFI